MKSFAFQTKGMTKKYIYSNVPIGEKSMCMTIDFSLKPVKMNDKSIIIYDGFTIEGIKDFKAFQGLEIFINNILVARFGFIEFYDITFINNIIRSDYIIINNYVDNITFRFRRNIKEYDIRGFKMSYNEHVKEGETEYETLETFGTQSFEKKINICNDYVKYHDCLGSCWPDRNVIEMTTNEYNDKKLKHVYMIKTPEGLEENDYKFSIGLDDNLTLSELNKIILKGIYDVSNIFITFDKEHSSLDPQGDKDKLKVDDNEGYFIILCKYA